MTDHATPTPYSTPWTIYSRQCSMMLQCAVSSNQPTQGWSVGRSEIPPAECHPCPRRQRRRIRMSWLLLFRNQQNVQRNARETVPSCTDVHSAIAVQSNNCSDNRTRQRRNPGVAGYYTLVTKVHHWSAPLPSGFGTRLRLRVRVRVGLRLGFVGLVFGLKLNLLFRGEIL